jgi:hypothetical protein
MMQLSRELDVLATRLVMRRGGIPFSTSLPASPFGNVIEGVGEIGVTKESEECEVSDYENTDTPNVDALVTQFIRERAVAAEAERRVRLVDEYGEDSVERFPEGTILRVAKTFRLTLADELKTYTYAALKVNGKWYLTGNTSRPSGQTWRKLVLWLVSGVDPVDPSVVEIVTALSPLETPEISEMK